MFIRKFFMNDESRYSITRPFESSQITDFIISSIKKDPTELIITDGKACVGGDTINFSMIFKHVNAVELNVNTYNLLLLNIKNFNRKNITTINNNYIQIYHTINQDVIYLDVPWNGPSYKYKKDLDLYISDIRLDILILDIQKIHKDTDIFVKLPLNINLSRFSYINIKIILTKSGKPSFYIIHNKK